MLCDFKWAMCWLWKAGYREEMGKDTDFTLKKPLQISGLGRLFFRIIPIFDGIHLEEI